MYTTLVCMLLKLKLYVAEVVGLVNLACPDADHVMCDNYAANHSDQ